MLGESVGGVWGERGNVKITKTRSKLSWNAFFAIIVVVLGEKLRMVYQGGDRSFRSRQKRNHAGSPLIGVGQAGRELLWRVWYCRCWDRFRLL